MLQVGILDKALSFGGVPGLFLLVGGNLSGVLFWLMSIANRNYKRAFFLLITLFPLTFYAGRAGGIIAYSTDNYDQRIGLTTLLLMGLALVLALSHRLKRPKHRPGRIAEYLMWSFCIAVTASQIATHEFGSAIWLSIGAAWQFLALFYIVTSLIQTGPDVLRLLNAFFICSVINILVRVIAKGEPLIVSLSSATAGDASTFGAETGRVGSGALGLAVSYAGYLAMFITLALGCYRLTKKRIYLLYMGWMIVELINTFTMGGIFVLFLLGLLLLFRQTRKKTLAVGLGASILAIPLIPVILRYLSLRGFNLNVFEVGNFSLRLELTSLYFSQYYDFSAWGVGILKETLIPLRPWLLVPIHNAYIDVLDTCGPAAALIFSLLSLYSIWLWFRLSLRRNLKTNKGPAFSLLAPFLFVTVVQWVVFANTTSTSITAYYPYEGTAIFWIVCFLAPVFAAPFPTNYPWAEVRQPHPLEYSEASARIDTQPVEG